MVRNEEDILPATLNHLLTQGIDGLVIADNASSDRTPDVIADYRTKLPTLWIASTLEKKFQAEMMTYMASLARSCGATWIVPFDADEFWFAEERSLGDELRRTTADVRAARIFNAFPMSNTCGYSSSEFRLDMTPHRHQKVALRSSRFLYIHQGNHSVERRGERASGLSILHYPWRSYAQLVEKARRGRQGYLGTSLPATSGYHLRYLGGLSESELGQIWRKIVKGDSVTGIDWSPVGPFRGGVNPENANCWLDVVSSRFQ